MVHDQVVNCHPSHVRKLQAALSAAIPFIFEHGQHVHPHCYRGSDDGCYCGLDEAQRLIKKTEE